MCSRILRVSFDARRLGTASPPAGPVAVVEGGLHGPWVHPARARKYSGPEISRAKTTFDRFISNDFGVILS